MQITRQRVRPEVDIKTAENCPTCNGTGTITASINISDQIEDNLANLLENQNEQKLSLVLHPYLYTYFTKGIFSIRFGWWKKFGKWVKIIEDSSLAVTEYYFLNSMKEKIKLE
jgi:ribonuclease G